MSDEFQKIVDEHGKTLRGKSRSELLDLQDVPTEIVEVDGRKGTIDLNVEEESRGSLRIVVQGFLDTKWFSRLGIKNVSLNGFRLEADGSISELRDEEYYEFD